MKLMTLIQTLVRWLAQHSAALVMLTGLALVAGAVAGLVSNAQAAPPAAAAASAKGQSPTAGEEIFDTKCAGCHSIGGGKLVGPDLKDVTKRRDTQWMKSFISDPAKMMASDPVAQQLRKENNNMTMPTLGLTPAEVDEVIAYLANPVNVHPAPAASGAQGSGDSAAGRRLFTGELALTNGGPECMACHSVQGIGGLGGGGLGPDLTHVVQRLGEPGLAAALKTIAFPTMMGPFLNKPLTSKEQADLVAFLKNADQWQDPVGIVAPGGMTNNALVVTSIGMAGALLLFGLLWFFWARIERRVAPRLPVRKAGAAPSKAMTESDTVASSR